MKFNEKYFKEYKDMFNVYNLITKINPNYKLFRNNKTNTFIIVNSAKNNQICLNFDNFNQNILKTLQYTKIENSKNVFNDIEKNNLIIKENFNKTLKKQTTDKMCEIANFSKRVNRLSTNSINKIIGAD